VAPEQFLFADDSNADKILMFTIARNLTNLVSADIIYGDGTFYTSPTQFTQLYTLNAMVDDVMYTLTRHLDFLFVCVCFNVTFSSISTISWRPVLVVEEARVPVENHRTWAATR